MKQAPTDDNQHTYQTKPDEESNSVFWHLSMQGELVLWFIR